MLAAILLLSLCAQLSLSAPQNRCVMFCDEPQLSAGYVQQQQPIRHHVQPVQSYNFFRPASYARPSYVPINSGMGPYNGRLETFDEQPARRTYHQLPQQVAVQPEVVAPSFGNVEATMFHSSSSSSSSNSATLGMIRYPVMQTGTVVQSEPIRRPLCSEGYAVDPCSY